VQAHPRLSARPAFPSRP